MDRKNCVVLVPVHQNIEPETENAIWELSRRGYPVRFLRGSSDIVLARSQMATDVLKEGFRETMWIDSDVVFNPDDVDRIRAHSKPIVAGLYPRKGGKSFAAKFESDPNGMIFGEGGGLNPMVYVGMGFTHVRAEVYEAIANDFGPCHGGYDGKTVIPFFMPLLATEPNGPCYLAEDYSFCARAKLYGFEIVADTSIKLGHVGKHTWTWDDFAKVDAEIYQAECTQHRNTLGVLRLVVSGKVDPARLTFGENSWELAPVTKAE